MEWGFPIDGDVEATAPSIEEQLRAIEGMVTADVDIESHRVQLSFDADLVCGGEILAVLKACGCPASDPYRVSD